MMVERDQAGLGKRWKKPQYSPTIFRMLIHQRAFVVGKRTIFVENGIRNADLADIVHNRSHLDIVEAFLLNSQLLPYPHAPLGEPGTVHSSIQILQIQELMKATDQRVHGAGKLLLKHL